MELWAIEGRIPFLCAVQSSPVMFFGVATGTAYMAYL